LYTTAHHSVQKVKLGLSRKPSHWCFVNRRITSQDVIEQLFNLIVFRGIPEHIRSDNGPEFTAKAVRSWLNKLGVKTLFIEPGSPWENGYIESFNGKLRDELLNREIFTTLTEARVLIADWRKEYNQVRPHSSLGGTGTPGIHGTIRKTLRCGWH
jgi:transposase InsO family protein